MILLLLTDLRNSGACLVYLSYIWYPSILYPSILYPSILNPSILYPSILYPSIHLYNLYNLYISTSIYPCILFVHSPLDITYIHMAVYWLYILKSIYLSIYLSINYPSIICLSIAFPLCISICLSIFQPVSYLYYNQY